tara:strand:- start:63 stop:239 length:177 start_codon:yes stop_codon:yes gene_type:complete
MEHIDYKAEWEIMRLRFIRTVKVENILIDIFSGKQPIPTDRQWFFDLAKQLGVPENYS